MEAPPGVPVDIDGERPPSAPSLSSAKGVSQRRCGDGRRGQAALTLAELPRHGCGRGSADGRGGARRSGARASKVRQAGGCGGVRCAEEASVECRAAVRGSKVEWGGARGRPMGARGTGQLGRVRGGERPRRCGTATVHAAGRQRGLPLLLWQRHASRGARPAACAGRASAGAWVRDCSDADAPRPTPCSRSVRAACAPGHAACVCCALSAHTPPRPLPAPLRSAGASRCAAPVLASVEGAIGRAAQGTQRGSGAAPRACLPLSAVIFAAVRSGPITHRLLCTAPHARRWANLLQALEEICSWTTCGRCVTLASDGACWACARQLRVVQRCMRALALARRCAAPAPPRCGKNAHRRVIEICCAR
jgi:hypothetical protein